MISILWLSCNQLQAFHILATARVLTPSPPPQGGASYLLHWGHDKCFVLSQVSCPPQSLLFSQPGYSPGKLLLSFSTQLKQHFCDTSSGPRRCQCLTTMMVMLYWYYLCLSPSLDCEPPEGEQLTHLHGIFLEQHLSQWEEKEGGYWEASWQQLPWWRNCQVPHDRPSILQLFLHSACLCNHSLYYLLSHLPEKAPPLVAVVCSGCHNHIPQTGGLDGQKLHFPHSPGDQRPWTKCRQG